MLYGSLVEELGFGFWLVDLGVCRFNRVLCKMYIGFRVKGFYVVFIGFYFESRF